MNKLISSLYGLLAFVVIMGFFWLGLWGMSDSLKSANAPPDLIATEWKDCYYTCSTDKTKRVYYVKGEWAGQSQIVAQHIFIVEGVQYVSQSTPHEWSVTISRLYDWSDVHPQLLDKLKEARDYFYEAKAKMEETEAKDAKRKGA